VPTLLRFELVDWPGSGFDPAGWFFGSSAGLSAFC
jgi:hypothetical protein